MPPPTSCNPVPHIYFLTWNNGEGKWGEGGMHTSLWVRGWIAALQWHLVLRVVLLPFDVTLCRTRRRHKENDIIGGWPQFSEPGEEVLPSPLLSSPLLTSAQGVKRPHTLPPCLIIYQNSFHREKKVQLSIFHLCTEKFIIPFPYTLITSVCISYPFHLKSTVLYIYYDYTRFVFLFFFFFLLWMFLCCTPSFLVVYWLLSCGMFVLSQSNVVFTLKPHFS